MPTEGSGCLNVIPQMQADSVLNQAAPVSGTKYTVLTATPNARIIHLYVRCTWTVQPTPLEAHLTIDGVERTCGFTNPVSDTWYEFDYWSAGGNGGSLVAQAASFTPFIVEGRSIGITAEITGGTVSNLSGRIKYARW